MDEKNIFSAKEPSLGYLYQMRQALYLLLKPTDNENPSISIESLDDIVIQDENNTDIYQIKYHLKKETNLSNMSPDFWKTIRIWCNLIINKSINLNCTIFTLVTTQKISDDSIFNKFGDELSIDEIINELDEIANKSKNEKTKTARELYVSLDIEDKKKLIKNIKFLTSSNDIERVKQDILKILRTTITHQMLTPLFERLEGWWLNKSILMLNNKIEYIQLEELTAIIWNIRDKLAYDNLPIDYIDPIPDNNDEIKNKSNQMFVKQLNIINCNKDIINNAISDYIRAFKQRSRWNREGLILPQEEIDFEKKLYDDWLRKHSIIRDDSIPDNEHEKKGYNFYLDFYVKNTPQIFIRDKVNETFVITGSCHILSDNLIIGWHPKYKEKLKDNKDVTSL